MSLHPDTLQSDEAFRRICNIPSRWLGPKAMTALKDNATVCRTSLLRAVETAALPLKARGAALAFATAIHEAVLDVNLSVVDRLSLLIDQNGHREMLWASKAETDEGRRDNLVELIQLVASFQSVSGLLDRAALASATPLDSFDWHEAHGRATSCLAAVAKSLFSPLHQGAVRTRDPWLVIQPIFGA